MSFLKDLGTVLNGAANVMREVNKEAPSVVVVNTSSERREKISLGTIKVDWTERMYLVNNGVVVLSVNGGKVSYRSHGFFKKEGTMLNSFMGRSDIKFTVTIPEIKGNMEVYVEDGRYVNISVD